MNPLDCHLAAVRAALLISAAALVGCGARTSGAFSMSTFQPGDGVVAGDYKVVIAPPLGTPDLTRYASNEEAMAAAAKAPPPKASSFPQQYTRPDQTPLTQKVPVSGKVTFDLKSK